jgi:FkbM family methyltransferase
MMNRLLDLGAFVLALLATLAALMYVTRRHDRRVFLDEQGNVVPHMTVEREEQLCMFRNIQAGDKVLELGGRYGTVSAVLMDMTDDVVVVEPDAKVLRTLEENLVTNGFRNAKVFHGTVGASKTKMSDGGGDGYAVQTVPCDGAECSVDHLRYDHLQERYGVVFDTIVADCEGCLPGLITHIMETNPTLGALKTVIFETDYEDRVDYEGMYATLRRLGFERTEGGFVQVWRRK